jgi:hypothetical protein
MILSVNAELHMFNPRPTIRHVPITAHHTCVVIDDFLLDPHTLVAHAVAQRAQFAIDPDNFYPGAELDLGRGFAGLLEQFVMLHIRKALGARRMLHTSSRLALATLEPGALHGLQRICHRDAVTLPGGEGVGASVAYLFDAPDMGGTSFYVARQSADDTAAYLRAVANGSQTPEPAYMTASSPWFEQVATVPAAFNRAIFYDGTVFHAAQIARPELLNADPARGRLTVNGFFRFRKVAA